MNLSRRCALSTLGEERSIDRNAGAPPRSGVDASTDGFAFDIDEATGIVRNIHRQDEVLQLGIGDRVVTLNNAPLTQPLREAVAPESVATLGLWKRPAEQMQPPLQDPHLDMQVEQLVWSEPPGWHRRRLCGLLPSSLRSLRRESSFRSTPRSGRDAFTARPADGGVRRPWW